jgi:hypothetical protein
MLPNPTQKLWIAKRNKAIERLVTALCSDACENDDGEDPANIAADAVTVAHIAATLEWDNGPPKSWNDERGKAIERLVRAWTKYKGNNEDDPEAEEELNIALDALAVAHTAWAFEFCSGPLKW